MNLKDKTKQRILRGIVVYSAATYAAVLLHWWAFEWLERGNGFANTVPGALLLGGVLSLLVFILATIITFTDL